LAANLDAALRLSSFLQQPEGELAYGAEVRGSIACANATVIFAERDIENPMQFIFDAPVTAYSVADPSG
jgi:hypothetical protein